MTPDLLPNQRLFLLALLARGGAGLNSELTRIVGLDASGRQPLERAGLIQKGPRLRNGSFAVELTDKGWKEAREAFAAAPAPRASSAARTLDLVLSRLDAFMTARSLSAADLFATSEPPADNVPAETEARIAEAYRALVAGPQDWLRLSALRRALADLPRTAVDAALLRLLEAGRISIEPVVDQKTLTADDRAASLMVGSAPAHHFTFRA